MKKKLLLLLSLSLLLTGCRGSKSEKMNETTEAYSMESGVSVNAVQDADGMAEDYLTEETLTEAAAEEASMETADNKSDSAPQKGNGGSTLQKEMLVYRGALSIDTLDFNKSVSDFKALLNEKGGFVESETYTDNYSTNSYYTVDAEKKHNIYTATVRIPSTEYDGVMNSATNLGDVRNRSSNASNVTQEYGTYQSQLEIYEAEYERYLTLLESATEDEYALEIENELFAIQVEIASLKSNITNIENDVAYSYIDITIKEVSEYEEEPASTDTFLDRLKNTCKKSWSVFLEMLEEIVFFLIMNVYFIVIILLIVFLIRRKMKKNAKKRMMNPAPVVNQTMVPNVNPVVNQTMAPNVNPVVNETTAPNVTPAVSETTAPNTPEDKKEQ